MLTAAAAAGEPLTGRVVSIADGDTLTVLDATVWPHCVRSTFAACE